MILGLALRVLLAAATVTAVAAVVVYVTGTITRAKVKEKLREKGVKDAMIDAIDRCNNVVAIKDMDHGGSIEIHGDKVSRDLDEGDRIYA